jgi:hypothetical protein
MDSPEFSLKPVRTDICEYLRQICGELVPQLEREGFKYEFDIPEESVFACWIPTASAGSFKTLRATQCGTIRPGTTGYRKLTVQMIRR